jgi:acyl-CoA synthetase (AMP-forming)/AMP-acid ligase II
VPAVRHHPDDVALLAYTSGTTGRPKGAQLSLRAFDAWFLISSLEEAETWSSDDVALGVMPNFHLAGSWVPLPALYHGGTIALVPAFEPRAVLTAIERHRPTVTCLVPTAIGLLLDHPDTAGHDFSSLRRWLYAGSTIGAETLRRALSTFGCDMVQFYGTSETYIISLLRPAEHDPDDTEALTSCGGPVPLVDIRVVDATGADVAAGEVGEVLVRSPMMFSGYWNLPDATDAALVEGWYHTGDLGRYDAAGRLHLVDRLKDMIVTGGENVYSVEVERALLSHPAVAGVGVVGVPDERWGERIVAAVVVREPVTADELVAHCTERIARYKAPKQIHFVDALPMTSSGKVRKTTLREQLAPAHA